MAHIENSGGKDKLNIPDLTTSALENSGAKVTKEVIDDGRLDYCIPVPDGFLIEAEKIEEAAKSVARRAADYLDLNEYDLTVGVFTNKSTKQVAGFELSIRKKKGRSKYYKSWITFIRLVTGEDDTPEESIIFRPGETPDKIVLNYFFPILYEDVSIVSDDGDEFYCVEEQFLGELGIFTDDIPREKKSTKRKN